MSQLETNLRSTAREAFRLYPEIYKVDAPADEQQIETLAHAYGVDDGFFEAGMEWEDVRAAVFAEWESWVDDCKKNK